MSAPQAPIEAAENMNATRAFWDANPCGAHGSYQQQREQRYAMEPWVPGKLSQIARRHASILEIGCGQGVDATLLCEAMAPGGRYVGIDYSPGSVAVAEANARARTAELSVTPAFQVGNAEALSFNDGEFDAVYSMGVLHHTADERRAVGEALRVLKPGGAAYIALYRKWSPKVGVARALRGIQQLADGVLGTERAIYRLLRQRGTSSRLFGTMFHECFGVPYLKAYDEAEMRALFGAFEITELSCIGSNLGRLSPDRTGRSSIGVFWWIEGRKPR
jgi:SAM-dependent methyltransferase